MWDHDGCHTTIKCNVSQFNPLLIIGNHPSTILRGSFWIADDPWPMSAPKEVLERIIVYYQRESRVRRMSPQFECFSVYLTPYLGVAKISPGHFEQVRWWTAWNQGQIEGTLLEKPQLVCLYNPLKSGWDVFKLLHSGKKNWMNQENAYSKGCEVKYWSDYEKLGN